MQEQLELESLDLGIARYHDMRARGEADLPPGMKLIKEHVMVIAAGISAYLESCAAGVASRNASLSTFLSQWTDEPELPAYVVCRAVIDSITAGVKLQTVARTIAVTLEDQVNHELLRKLDPRAYRQLQRKLAKSASAGYKHVVLRKQQKFAGIKSVKWGISERVRVGTLLVQIMCDTTKLFNITRMSEGRHDTPLVIVPTDETISWLESSHTRSEILAPTFLPMVVKPRAWSNPFNGGYLKQRMRFPMIKGANRNLLEELKSVEMPTVYRALNAMQDTAWSINDKVHRIMVEAWEGGGTVAGLPSRHKLQPPTKDFTNAEAEANAPKFKAWKGRAAETHTRNVAMGSKRIAMHRLLWVAEKMAPFEKFHFVHALDFRGRAYAVAAFLNPQSDDCSKALLRFANSKPLGDTGAFWLAVHGSNTFGVDKVSFEDRVKWVQGNQDAILESAFNPLTTGTLWTTADSPWQFLAFCCEWAGLIAWWKAGQPQSEFMSALPVGMDGACNGLQNFSAMLRDEVGGAATNLTPSATPSDIYAEVAVAANAMITADIGGPRNVMASKWAGKITRKLTKRNTMTVPYAVSEFGMRNQLLEEFRKLQEDTAVAPEIASAGLEDAIYLASINYAAIGTVVVAARSAMDWLKSVAHVVAADGLPVQWTTPSGFLVVQDYREMLGTRLDFSVCGRRFALMIERKGDKLNRRKQSSGISPNFVHALDAAHLQRTVSYCLDAGITSFAMVHDSYGCHASDIEVMSTQLRRAFIDQYSVDVLGAFREQMIKLLPEKLQEKIPPCPPMGSLDLTAVMASDYFFA